LPATVSRLGQPASRIPLAASVALDIFRLIGVNRGSGKVMRQATHRAVLALAIPATLFALTGCGMRATSAAGGDVNQADLEYVTQAYNIIAFNREECSLAQAYAQTPEVKEIAAKLLDDTNAFAAKLDAFTKARGIDPPTVLRTDLRVRLYHLRLNYGLDFDRWFMEDRSRQQPPTPAATPPSGLPPLSPG
jgi:predicted outer membrane protein